MTRDLRIVFSLLFALALLSITTLAYQPTNKVDSMASKLYGFTVKTIDGKERPLSDYKGKVVMIVNVASECGFTPQYKSLQEIYEKFKARGFVILGFPSNDFGQQEPGTDVQIKQFCESKYGVTFDMFSKIDVKGDHQAPLYKYLTTECEAPHEITWNFNKFLVDRAGKVVGYYPSQVKPTDDALTKKIEELLASPD